MVILPDSVRNYMTKFLNDDWMEDRGFIAAPALDPATQEWCVVLRIDFSHVRREEDGEMRKWLYVKR